MAIIKKLGRTTPQRKAMIRSLVTQMIQHGKVKTTLTRAKVAAGEVDKLIALAVKECDNFEEVTVKAKVAKKDKDGKRVKEVVDGKKVTVYETVEKEIKKDAPSKLHARRQMLKVLYTDETNKLFDEIAPKYVNRNGGYTRIVKIGQRKGDGALEVVLELV